MFEKNSSSKKRYNKFIDFAFGNESFSELFPSYFNDWMEIEHVWDFKIDISSKLESF